ncbi:DUF4293 domain-containing protein [Spongiivirga sp. MCCC 1A20706]|uniref:DUF4293 domain-containing protein n=1 Tax=Spongiivirga sp. MCCC 1A20706 TaxID=3160963 RepID=UPI00397786FF
MLQRIQTVYLLIVSLVMGLGWLWTPLYTNAKDEQVFAIDNIYVMCAFIACSVLALISIFAFKKRQNQFVLNRLNMIFNVTLLGVLVYWSLSISGETSVSEKGIEKLIPFGSFLPIISIVFLVLANKAIKKDEDLVKSVDRLR